MIVKSAYIEITNRCNLDCRDCYNGSGKNKKTVELDPEALMHFIKDLKLLYGVRAVVLSGGEPLLHTRIDEILKSISEFCTQYQDMDFNIITNGTTDNALFYELMETDSHFSIQISLDGPNESANASMRGPGNFTRVLANTGKRRFYNKPIYKMILNQKNASFVEEYFHLIFDDLGGLPAFAFTSPQGNAVTHWDEMALPVRERSDIILKIHHLYKEHDLDGLTLPLPTSCCDLTKADGENSFCIRPDGSIQPCQNLYDARFAVGNLYHCDWEDISRKISSLSSFLSSRFSCDYGCSKCPIRNTCGRGCPAISYITAGDLLASDGECELRKLSTFRMIKASKIF
ncbi:MAG: radical SAM protein [Clostridia bacterium]